MKLRPTQLGQTLVDCYTMLGIELYKPYLRAQIEADMKAIGEGRRNWEVVKNECISEMRKIFNRTVE